MKRWIKKFIDVINSICLCIRFPFLWQRNRFTGLHYNNYKFHEKICNLGDKSIYNTFLHIKPFDSFSGCICSYNVNGIPLGIRSINHTKFQIFNEYIDHDLYTIDVNDYLESIPEKGNYEITNLQTICCWKKNNDNEYVLTLLYNQDEVQVKEYKASRYLRIIIRPVKYILYKILRWIYRNPLQWIMCIPKRTELSNMDTGWRKAFGIQMCKEIRGALIKKGGLKLLFSYRIMDIKEKYGTLRWYDAGAAEEIYEIISKYETISGKTCIICGKPAKYITSGWISPYCENCIGDDIDTATEIKQKMN